SPVWHSRRQFSTLVSTVLSKLGVRAHLPRWLKTFDFEDPFGNQVPDHARKLVFRHIERNPLIAFARFEVVPRVDLAITLLHERRHPRRALVVHTEGIASPKRKF